MKATLTRLFVGDTLVKELDHSATMNEVDEVVHDHKIGQFVIIDMKTNKEIAFGKAWVGDLRIARFSIGG